MSLGSEVDLKSELEVSRNVIRVLMKDLLEAENKIKDLETARLVTSASEPLREESIGHNSLSLRTTRSEDNGPPELGSSNNTKLESHDAEFQDNPSADMIIKQLQEQCNNLLEERVGLRELVAQSQDKAKGYKEKSKSLNEERDAMEMRYSQLELGFKTEIEPLRDAIVSYIQLSDRIPTGNNFDPKVLMDMRPRIQANNYQEETVSFSNDPHNLTIPKNVQRLLRSPDCAPLSFHDNGAIWCHPTGSYILSFAPAFMHDQGVSNHLQTLIPKKKDFKKDLFCFHSTESVWKYYGVFSYVGSKMVTIQQAREELEMPEETIELIRHRLSTPHNEWVEHMYMEGIFKILCTGIRRVGFNEQLMANLKKPNRGSVPVPAEGQNGGQSKAKRKKSSGSGSQENHAKRKKK